MAKVQASSRRMTGQLSFGAPSQTAVRREVRWLRPKCRAKFHSALKKSWAVAHLRHSKFWSHMRRCSGGRQQCARDSAYWISKVPRLFRLPLSMLYHVENVQNARVCRVSSHKYIWQLGNRYSEGLIATRGSEWSLFTCKLISSAAQTCAYTRPGRCRDLLNFLAKHQDYRGGIGVAPSPFFHYVIQLAIVGHLNCGSSCFPRRCA
jgi:hypothetical protein